MDKEGLDDNRFWERSWQTSLAVPVFSVPPGSRSYLGPKTKRLRVGIFLDDLPARLPPVADVEFFDLGKNGPWGKNVPWGKTDDWAAVISQLDLVISVDAPAAYLAGRIGKPTWVLLPANTEFRGCLKGRDAPGDENHILIKQQDGQDWDSVIQSVARALTEVADAIRPDDWTAWNTLGGSLLTSGDEVKAEACFHRALALNPGHADTLCNIAKALHRQGKMEQSMEFHRQAVAAAPDSAQCHTFMALTLLTMGRYEEGWREYEWRWRGHPAFPDFMKERPWKGEPLGDGTLLLHAEQGFGDMIQFIRFASLLSPLAKRIVLICQPELARLMETVAGIDEVHVEGRAPPPFTAGIALLSVPGLMKAGTGPIPDPSPYLSAPGDAGFDLGPKSARLRVGLAWAGRPTHRDDCHRSIAPAMLAPLFQVPGVEFVSLQKGSADFPPSYPMRDAGSRCVDFADTAAMIAQLDLVISVDTSVAHLAGAMGKSTWLMLPAVPDFRWRLEGDRTPWYKSLTLFRREQGRGWEPVILAIRHALNDLVQERPAFD